MRRKRLIPVGVATHLPGNVAKAIVFDDNCMGLIGVIGQNYYFSAKQNAKRLHGPTNSLVPRQCTVPPSLRYPILMTKKTKTKTKRAVVSNARIQALEKQLAAVKIKAKSPFSNAGALAGARAGQMFNLPMLKGVGRWLGSGIGSIFGSGDYTMTGANPSYNVLANGAQIPKFSSTHATNIVCHREYLGDILGTAAFTNTAYPLNPGIPTTFPWLSTIADNYQEYKFHGVIFEFRPLITDFVTGGAPGVVIMATNYNADLPVYTTKQVMENSEFAVSVKPTNTLIHGIECSPEQTDPIIKYVRNGALATGQDLKNYDWGNFQFATQSNPIQNLGELWVSYCVEFYKPVLNTTSGPVVAAKTSHIGRSSFTNASPYGTVGVSVSGSMTAAATATVLTVSALSAGELIQITWVWNGTTPATIVFPVITPTNGTAQSFYKNGVDSTAIGGATASLSRCVLQTVMLVTAAGDLVLTAGVAGTLPTGTTNLDIYVSRLDATTTA